ncbi:MAG: hypothetical protein AAB932_04715 [Patescibacteria group bacterium]
MFFASPDTLVLTLFAVCIILHLLFVKKEHLFVNLVAVYIAFALLFVVPLASQSIREWLSGHPFARGITFLAAVVLIHALFRKSNIKWFSRQIAPTQFSTSFLYRIAIVGLCFSAVFFFLPEDIRARLGAVIDVIFLNWIALLFWFCLPLFLAFAYRFKARNGWVE